MEFYVFLIIAVLLSSCSAGFCDSFESAVRTTCKERTDSCFLSMGKVFHFDWDSLYIFDSELYPDEVSDRLKMDCDCKNIPDGQRRFYFTKRSRIVKQFTSGCYRVNFVEKGNEKGDGVVVADPQSIYLVKNTKVNGETSYYLFKQ